jgi:O-antigen ligase
MKILKFNLYKRINKRLDNYLIYFLFFIGIITAIVPFLFNLEFIFLFILFFPYCVIPHLVIFFSIIIISRKINNLSVKIINFTSFIIFLILLFYLLFMCLIYLKEWPANLDFGRL